MIPSLVIVTKNRPKKLKKCLDCLLLQTIFPSELIIVDSSDDQKTKILTERFRKSSDFKVAYYKIKNISIPFARNQGLSKVKKGIIAFTDDDCHPKKNWIEKIVKAHKRFPRAAAIGGPVLNYFPSNYWAETSKKMLDLYFNSHYRLHLETFLFTNNLSFKKRILEKEKIFFDENLLGIEDVDICKRIEKKGYQVYYDPSIVVAHDYRTSLGGFLNQWFFYGKANYRFYKKYLYNVFQSTIKEFFLFTRVKGLKSKIGALQGRSFWVLGVFWEFLKNE